MSHRDVTNEHRLASLLCLDGRKIGVITSGGIYDERTDSTGA